MSSPGSHWAVLGIAPTADTAAIRRAYAARLKVTRPEDNRAGFEQLRAAYELAMRLARGGADFDVEPAAVAVAEPPRPAPATVSATVPVVVQAQATVSDPSLEQLQTAFGNLQRLLDADDAASPRADEVLSRILDSPSLENLAVEQRVQWQLSAMLAASIPRSDPLLLRASNRFRWSLPEAQLQVTPAIANILTRIFDLQFLDELRSGRSRYAPGFRKLQQRPIPLVTWAMAHFNKTGVPNEYQVLQLVRLHHPGLLSLLEPSKIAWWDRMAGRPRVSLPIVLIGIIVTVVAYGGMSVTDKSEALWLAGGYAAFFSGLVLWKLYLLDWPRHLLRARWPVLPLALRAAWLPASVAIVLLSAIVPSSKIAAWLFLVPGLCLVQWAWIVGGMDAQPGRSDLLSLPLFRVVLHNFLIALWWFAALEEMPTSLPVQAAVLCALISSSVGSPAMRAAWEQQFTSSQRTAWISVVAFITIVAVACLVWLTPIENWRLMAATLVIVAVVAHRHAAIMLGRRQQEFRFGWMIVFFVLYVGAAVQSVPWLESRGPILTGCGVLFASTVLLCNAMMLWNERRGRVAAYRDDPVHESLQW